MVGLKYSILAGLTAGFTVGIKGYVHLFIPGIVLFLIIYGKNNRVKWSKVLYIVLFTLLGCFLFAAYNWVQNYISFGNIFSSTQTSGLMRINNPSVKTFISNFIRHLVSFYQLRGHDFGILSVPMEKFTYFIHNKMNLDISSPATTWPGQQFYFPNLVFDMDLAYFGPVCSLIIIPSVLYNIVIFTLFKRIRRDAGFKEKYKNTLKILIIPVVFFISYTLIFKWQPWAGRLMISFALLMMFSFAILIELFRNINVKYLFSVIISVIIFIAIIFSGKVLFNSCDPKILPIGNRSIYSYDYDERRYIIVAPYMEAVKEMVNDTIGEKSNLGLATCGDDWDYIYFGKDFKRNLYYILEEEYTEKDILDILKDNNLDGLLLNTKGAPDIGEEVYQEKIKGVNYNEEDAYVLFYR